MPIRSGSTRRREGIRWRRPVTGLGPEMPSASADGLVGLIRLPEGRQHETHEDQPKSNCPEGQPDAQAGSLKGGDPAAGSPTATLLRLHPSR
jgi:hypothetical protein